MKKIFLLLCLTLLLGPFVYAQFPSVSPLTALGISTNTREKPQSKVWTHDGKHWTVQSDSDGAHVFRLDGTTWTRTLTLYYKKNRRADCKVDGNLVHILLYRADETDLISIQYVPGSNTYQKWSARTSTVRIPTSTQSETATIDIDTNGRMWMAEDDDANILVRYSDSPYSNWSAPITVASGINADDIGAVIAFPMMNKIGVFWSNQNTKRWGFKLHDDGTNPNIWSADEVPASQSAINFRAGMADDHLNMALASDGTLYCAIKTSYDTPGYPRIAMLVRRPSGSWDNLYGVSEIGTRGIAILNEQTGKIRVVYTENEDGGDILYRESSTANISFGPQYTLIAGKYNNATSTKNSFTSEVAIIASSLTTAVSVLVTDNGTPPPPLPGAPTLVAPAHNATNVNLNTALSWNTASNAATYQVQVSSDANFSTLLQNITNLNALTLSPAGLQYSTQYFWRVRGENASGPGNWSAIRSFTTRPEPVIVPDVPTLNLPANNAVAISTDPTLSWNVANNAASYKLQVSTVSSFTSTVADLSGITATSKQINNLNYSTQYFWRVKAVNSNSESNWSVTRAFTTAAPPINPPGVPALVSPANGVTEVSLTTSLTWNAVTNADSYNVQVATSSNFSSLVTNTNVNGLSTSLTGLAYGTQYFWRVNAENVAGTGNWSAVRSFTTLAQPTSLVGHWEMEGGTGGTLTDASGYGNHATTFGNPGFTTGVYGQSLRLNGSNQYATVPSSASLNPANAITLAAWIKPSSSGSRQVVLQKGHTTDGYELSITGSRKVTFRYNQISAGKDYQLVGNIDVPVDGNTWMHIAATFDGTTARIYINGSLDASKRFASPVPINASSEAFSIGALASGSSRFHGAIDDARIYNVALSASTISSLATMPNARMVASQNQVEPTAHPNPFQLTSKLSFTTQETGEYTLTLYNITGKPVKILKKGYATAGEKIQTEMKGSELQYGLYMVRLQTDSGSQSVKIMHKPTY